MKNLIYGTLLAMGLAGCQNNQPKPEVSQPKSAEVYHFTLDGTSTYYKVDGTNCMLSFENPEYSFLILDRGCNESVDVVIASKKFKENPEKWLSPTINGGDFRHFSNHGFSKIKSSEINCSIHP